MKRLLTYLLLFSVSFARAGEAEPVVITEQARQRASDLLSRMTLRQKCILISGIMESGGSGNKNTLGACPELGVPPVLMVDGPQGVSNSRRTKPSTYYACGVSLAATFDREAALRMGDALGLDARARGAGFLLGPGVNIYRTALCGRNFEYFGEDPYLAGEIAKQYILGVQSHGVIATVKHFAVNNQEWDRFICSSTVDERTLNEIYFPAFRKAVQEASVGAVMTACGKLNGLQCSENPYLLRQTLRDAWGFDGITMCDWQTIYSTLNGIQGGIDVEMPNPFTHDYDRVKLLIDNGAVDEREIDQKCLHVLQTLISFGLLDRAHTDESIPFDNPCCHEAAYTAAVGGPVLLKNNGVLPLKKGGKGKILLTGPYCDAVCSGGGSGWVLPFEGRYVTTYSAMQKQGRGYALEKVANPSLSQIRAARAVIVEVGFGRYVEKENTDHEFALPAEQEALLETVASNTDKMIVVVHSGCEVDMRRWAGRAAAIIYAWYGGEHTGTVLADILSGKVSPSGRLPFTMWGSFENNPCSQTYWADDFIEYHNRPRFKQNPHCDYKEGIFVGYRGIEKFGRTVLYPFGYGLTYSNFSYSRLSVLPAGDGFDVSFTVSNIGKNHASEVAQVYVSPVNPSVLRPVRELKEFAKVALAKGERCTVSVHLPRSAFEHYDTATHSWLADPGTYIIQVGDNEQHIILEQEVSL